ncbi:hypothetical protein QRT08_18045 [Halalkalicoccus sp. NIPERK01]|nr:hypothetical protein [Halalkalicoccus sp. NIPERK01]
MLAEQLALVADDEMCVVECPGRRRAALTDADHEVDVLLIGDHAEAVGRRTRHTH